MQAFETVGTIDTKGQLSENDWAHQLNSDQQLELETALTECETPSTLTSHEEVIKMSRQWLQE